MRRAVLAVVAAMFLVGCAGQQINTDEVLNLGADIAFYRVVKNHPEHKDDVVKALQTVKGVLAVDGVTYLDLRNTILQYVHGDYAAEMTIVADYVLQDSAVVESLPLLDTYRAELLKRVDRLIVLTQM